MPYPSKIDAPELGSTCLDVVEREGWDAWTIRDVATHLGVSPNAIYRHVDGRDGLIVHIGAAAALALRDDIAAAAGEDPIEHIVDMARRYVRFAAERPAAYQAFVEAKPSSDDPAYLAWAACWAVVLDAAVAVAPDAAEACGFALWSMLHGRVDLTRGPTAQIDAGAGLADGVRVLVGGFASAGPIASPLTGSAE
ncbi:MAG: TetR/AcrR family transcriptional regulator [Actinomycetota bacterium]